jgi:hypothetical protein
LSPVYGGGFCSTLPPVFSIRGDMAREITIKVGLDSAEAERKANEFGRKFKSALDPAQTGVQRQAKFADGGIVSASGQAGGQTIVIDNLTIAVRAGMNQQDAAEIFVAGGTTQDGQNVIVNRVRKAKLNREF